MSNIGIQLKNMAIRKSQPVLPKELLAICISADSATKYYYSTLGKKTGWRSYDNTMALKTMLSRPLNPSIQDTTPDLSFSSSRNLRNLEAIFDIAIKHDRELIIISESLPSWSGITMDNTLFLRGNGLEHISSLEYDSLKESIVAVIELAEELLKCDTLVICLDRNDKNSCLSTLIRSFFYFGFELVPPGTYNHSNEFILVGMEL
ncbi:ornithine decarboxylase antizyme-domain-containing protein [Rhizophagus diaphanus]|nr:ornithine decarboxylase antizyme-domain-containing protein [Rhizophagus diaphanus] [Rhizophagus sp. MUCL 43196]